MYLKENYPLTAWYGITETNKRRASALDFNESNFFHRLEEEAKSEEKVARKWRAEAPVPAENMILPEMWRPFVKNVAYKETAHTRLWSPVHIISRNETTLKILLRSEDYPVITKILFSLKTLVENEGGGIVKELDLVPALVDLLDRTPDVNNKLLTLVLLETLVPHEGFFNQMYSAQLVRPLWKLCAQEVDNLLLYHCYNCISNFLHFETVLNHLFEAGACIVLNQHLSIDVTLIKTLVYDVLYALIQNDDLSCLPDSAAMDDETFAIVMFDIINEDELCPKALRHMSAVLSSENGRLSELFQVFNGPERLLKIVQENRLSDCHKHAFSLMEKYYKAPYSYINCNPQKVWSQLFSYFNGRQKASNIAALLRALCRVAETQPAYQNKILRMGITVILEKILKMEETEADLLLAACECVASVSGTREGVDTLHHCGVVQDLARFVLSAQLPLVVRTAAASAVSHILHKSRALRIQFLLEIEDYLQAMFDSCSSPILLKVILECFCRMNTDEFSFLKEASLRILMDNLILNLEERSTDEVYSVVCQVVRLVVRAQPDLLLHLRTRERLVERLGPREDASVPLVESVRDLLAALNK